mgnify:FL=1
MADLWCPPMREEDEEDGDARFSVAKSIVDETASFFEDLPVPRVRRRRNLCLDLEEPKEVDFLGEVGSSVIAAALSSSETRRSGKVSGMIASGLAEPAMASARQTASSSALGNFTTTLAPITSDLKCMMWEVKMGVGVDDGAVGPVGAAEEVAE